MMIISIAAHVIINNSLSPKSQRRKEKKARIKMQAAFVKLLNMETCECFAGFKDS